MACGSCKTCVARCSNHPVSCGHAPSQRPSPMISQKLSEPLHNLPMKPEPALADLHRIPDATFHRRVQTRPLLPLCAFGFGQTLGQTGVPDVSAGASTLAKLAWQEGR